MLKFLRNLVLVAGAFLALPVLSANLSLFTGPSGTNPINFPAALSDLNTLINAVNTAFAPLGLNNVNTAQTPAGGPLVRLYSLNGTNYQIASTAELTLASYTIPANTFSAAGGTIVVKAHFYSAANGDTKAFRLTFMGTEYGIPLAGNGDNGSAGFAEFRIASGVTANTQVLSGWLSQGVTPNVYYVTGNTILTQTNSQPMVVGFVTKQGSSTAGDTVLDSFDVVFEN